MGASRCGASKGAPPSPRKFVTFPDSAPGVGEFVLSIRGFLRFFVGAGRVIGQLQRRVWTLRSRLRRRRDTESCGGGRPLVQIPPSLQWALGKPMRAFPGLRCREALSWVLSRRRDRSRLFLTIRSLWSPRSRGHQRTSWLLEREPQELRMVVTLFREKKMRNSSTALLLLVLAGSLASASPVVGPITNPANGHDYYLLEASTCGPQRRRRR